jgi:hypothetical protein
MGLWASVEFMVGERKTKKLGTRVSKRGSLSFPKRGISYPSQSAHKLTYEEHSL